jgi:peptide/nickel transport system substrate-binding protein
MFRSSDRRLLRYLVRQTVLLIAVFVFTACAPATRPAASSPPDRAQNAAEQVSLPHGTLTIAWAQEPSTLRYRFGDQGFVAPELGSLFDSSLTISDNLGALHPVMAERLPTQENGDWVVNPDGTMQTTYHLRPGIRWHDGTPVTASDFVFAHRVYADPLVPMTRTIEGLVSDVAAPDDRTVLIRWSQTYVRASEGMRPLPRHVLEEKYRIAKGDEFISGPEWTTSFVGAGPYRLERWEPGTRITARAVADWFLGPPHIESLEIRFIADPNTVLAHLLAGQVDIAWTPLVRFDITTAQEFPTRGGGYLKSWENRFRYLEVQYRAVPGWQQGVTDPRVRRALIHAIDRPAIADVATGGLGRVADAWVVPTDPVYPEVDRAITKYSYDPSRASALLAEAGWRAPTGLLVTDADGKTLDVEMNAGSTGPQVATIIADYWKAVGINPSVAMVPAGNARDPVFRATFTAAHIGETNATPYGFRFISSMIPDPPRTLGWNVGSYSDPEVDRLHNTYMTSVDERTRRDAYVALNQRMSAQAAYSPLYYPPDLLLGRNRLAGPVGEMGSGLTWNIFEWEVSD